MRAVNSQHHSSVNRARRPTAAALDGGQGFGGCCRATRVRAVSCVARPAAGAEAGSRWVASRPVCDEGSSAAFAHPSPTHHAPRPCSGRQLLAAAVAGGRAASGTRRAALAGSVAAPPCRHQCTIQPRFKPKPAATGCNGTRNEICMSMHILTVPQEMPGPAAAVPAAVRPPPVRERRPLLLPLHHEALFNASSPPELPNPAPSPTRSTPPSPERGSSACPVAHLSASHRSLESLRKVRTQPVRCGGAALARVCRAAAHADPGSPSL